MSSAFSLSLFAFLNDVKVELLFYFILNSAIIVPTGGGGLLAGIAVAAKALKPSITIIVRILSSFNFDLKLKGSAD